MYLLDNNNEWFYHHQNDEGVRFLVDEMEKLQSIYGNISTEQATMLKKLIETASEATNVKLQYEAIADAAAHAVNDKNKYTAFRRQRSKLGS